ncbi:MAG: gliding motility-associated C-terminal domain-containing protein [Burkholderiales bacterium]|nr:gliding motility-associated C-terminal domain-containing protein [Bacteroidia bacterium]
MKNKFIYTILFVASITISYLSFGQVIYQHNFGTSTFTAVNPYGVAPSTIDPALSASQWTTSFASGFSSLAGATGQALSISNSGGTPTYSLSYTVAPGFLCDITKFSFWRQRSGTGAQNWTLTVNGITTIGAGTTPTVGISTGTLLVSNAANGLSGAVNVVLQLSGATGTGSFRLDDFTLYGNVYSSCTAPTIQATSLVSSAITTSSANLNWTAGNGGNVIVLARQASAVNATPLSGTIYAANAAFALGQQIGVGNYVVYNGAGTSANVTNLTPGTNYYFSVFEYNSAGTCYLIPALTGSLTTVGCTPPTIQSSLFTSSSINNTSVNVTWTSGNGGNAIVFARQTALVDTFPINNVTYTANSVFASGQQVGPGNYVVYNGIGNSVTVTGLNPGTDYYFSVFEYNSGTNCYLLPALTGTVITTNTITPGSTCLKIKTLLIDACGSPEPLNEMVYFQNGALPLPINQISIAGAPTSGVYALNKWPNNNNLWNGLVQNATTASKVSAINSTITACGLVLEPPLVGGIGTIPANANVILVGSQNMLPFANSFSNLTDTVYMVFQAVTTTTAGQFTNFTAGPGTRSFVIIDNLHACTSNSVTYQPWRLINIGDGDAVAYDGFNNSTYFNSGCQAPYIPFAVTVSPNQTVCYNSVATVTATPSGVYNSVSWSGGTGVFSAPSSLTTSYTPGAFETGTVQLTCSITRTCASNSFSASATVTISITSLPVFSLAASNGYSLCPSSISVMTYSVINAANAGVITPSWSSPSGSGTTYTVSSPSGTASASYSLNLTNACGTTLNTFTVYPLVLPTVTLSATTLTACVGSTLSLSATGNTTNFSWNNPISTNSIVTVTANTTTTGIVTSTNSCGSASNTYTLTVTQNPSLMVNNPNVTLCAGQSATITATSSSGTYTWMPGSINTNSIVVNSAGTHTVTTSNVCNSSSVVVNVSFNATPTLSISTSSNSLCAGGQTTSTLSLVGSTGSYTWSTGANTPTLSISTPGVYTATVNAGVCGIANASININVLITPTLSIAATSTLLCNSTTATLTASSNLNNFSWSNSATNTPTIAVTTAGVYTVSVSNACGAPSASVNLLADVTPTLNLVSNTPTLCPAQSASLTVSGGIAPYTWSNSASTGTVVTTNGGTVSVTFSNACGTDTKSISVSIVPNPTVTLTTNSFTVCSGNVINIIANSTNNNYSWSGSSNTNATLTLTASATTTGTVTSTNACSSSSDSYTINVVAAPTLSVDFANINLCTGQSAIITATSSIGNYTWMPGGITTNTLMVNSANVYTVETSNVCYTLSATSSVVPLSLPVISLTSNTTTICPNETATLTVTGGTSPYVWSNSSSTGSVVTSNGGTVTVSNTNGCGTASQTININVININASISANPTSGVKPVIVDFTNNSNGAINYSWNFGNGNSANTQTVSSQTYSVAGTYTVYLTASNGSCTDTDFLIITVLNEEPTLIIPNVFTPNNDSVNDVFRVTGFNIIEFNCTIVDRWGLQMYQWDTIKTGWDGKSNGKEVPDGTYFYIIIAKDIDNREIKKQGAFSLFK